MAEPIDLGRPAVDAATCSACGLGDRPLWAVEASLRCASCVIRLYPGVAITFWVTVRETVSQPTLL